MSGLEILSYTMIQLAIAISSVIVFSIKNYKYIIKNPKSYIF